MSFLLFRLNNVPEDEALEIRILLDEHGVDYYETDSGFFGTSVPGFWLRSSEQLREAKALIDEYQSQRSSLQKNDYEVRRNSGDIDSIWSKIRKEPVKVVLCFVIVLSVLSLTLIPFFRISSP